MTTEQANALLKAHETAITRAMTWAMACAKHHKTENKHASYERAETAFARKLAELLNANKR